MYSTAGYEGKVHDSTNVAGGPFDVSHGFGRPDGLELGRLDGCSDTLPSPSSFALSSSYLADTHRPETHDLIDQSA